jgi:hypothetical protein
MYFYVQGLMTEDQLKKAQEMKVSKFPGFSAMEINERLCALCSILDKEQMEKIPAFYYQIKWKHKTLYDWYIQHCKDDIAHNKD